ncbi:MAG: amidase [Betaproteobacteria bacterium]
MEHDLPFLCLTELSQQLAAGRTTSRRIVADCLARIVAQDDKLHAFIDVYADDAIAAAEAADLERAAGFVRGPLHGLPIALKDLLHIEGRQTTAGSKSWLGQRSKRTATCVSRLVAAGMIPLGKTHMVEFAFGTWGLNRPLGAPWNPWDLTTHRVAGGSSSGSAVAVAAGMAPAAIGSDTGGSVRIPASLNGLTGLKLTCGLVSLAGVVPLSTTLDSIGPLTRTIDDAALLVAAMAGPDPDDAATLAVPQIDLVAALSGDADIRGMRITCLAAEQLPANADPDVLRVRAETIDVLRGLGALVDEAPIPFEFAELGPKNGRLIAIEAYAFHRAYIEDPALDIDPAVRGRIVGGKGATAVEYLDALSERDRAAAAFADWMRGRDLLLTPMLPIAAIPVAAADEATAPLATFSRAVNYLKGCAVSLPAGLSGAGLPIGMQLVGAAFADASLVRAGRAFQRATDWHRRRPDLSALRREAID